MAAQSSVGEFMNWFEHDGDKREERDTRRERGLLLGVGVILAVILAIGIFA